MNAVDTNIVVRFVTRDDPVMVARADHLLAGPCFVSLTVLLEVAWVLGSRFGFTQPMAASALGTVIDMPTIHVADEGKVRWALSRVATGADIADMLHLAGIREASTFVTFDRRLARQAGTDTPIPIETIG